jgi:hypothetical protein
MFRARFIHTRRSPLRRVRAPRPRNAHIYILMEIDVNSLTGLSHGAAAAEATGADDWDNRIKAGATEIMICIVNRSSPDSLAPSCRN